jgi:hypothetical protein
VGRSKQADILHKQNFATFTNEPLVRGGFFAPIFSGQELSDENYILAKNFPAKKYPPLGKKKLSEELSGEELSEQRMLWRRIKKSFFALIFFVSK